MCLPLYTLPKTSSTEDNVKGWLESIIQNWMMMSNRLCLKAINTDVFVRKTFPRKSKGFIAYISYCKGLFYNCIS